jgi:hypothetical protein
MNNSSIFLFPILIAFLAGCTTLSPVGKAYKNDEACYVEITKNSHVQRVDREIIPDPKVDPAIRYKLLNSTDRVQENQKQSLGIYIMLVQQCQDKFVIALSGTPLQKMWQKYFARRNSQMNLLYKSDITIGEYNTADLVDSKQFGLELQKAYQGMIQQNGLDQLNAYSLMGGSSSSYILPPAPINRTIPILGESPPAYVPPVQTFCQPNAGGFSCITR